MISFRKMNKYTKAFSDYYSLNQLEYFNHEYLHEWYYENVNILMDIPALW